MGQRYIEALILPFQYIYNMVETDSGMPHASMEEPLRASNKIVTHLMFGSDTSYKPIK